MQICPPITWVFIKTTEELAPSEVDEWNEMERGGSLEEAEGRAVDGVARILGISLIWVRKRRGRGLRW